MTTVSAGLTLSGKRVSSTIQQRFKSKCAPKNADGCVLWLGSMNNTGYGMLGILTDHSKRHMAYAHRVAWALVHGDIPPSMVVCHTCDNRACVNIDHLFLGTYKQNTLDMVKKNRHYWRRPLPWQKLSRIDVERIRDCRFSGCTQQAIADWIGVSRPLISMVLSGRIQHAR